MNTLKTILSKALPWIAFAAVTAAFLFVFNDVTGTLAGVLAALRGIPSALAAVPAILYGVMALIVAKLALPAGVVLGISTVLPLQRIQGAWRATTVLFAAFVLAWLHVHVDTISGTDIVLAGFSGHPATRVFLIGFATVGAVICTYVGVRNGIRFLTPRSVDRWLAKHDVDEWFLGHIISSSAVFIVLAFVIARVVYHDLLESGMDVASAATKAVINGMGMSLLVSVLLLVVVCLTKTETCLPEQKHGMPEEAEKA